MKRRLIICCDGTWQDLAQPYPTNVINILQSIKAVDDNDIHQVIYYDEGLGTKQMDSEESLVDRLIKLGGGALGLGIDHKIQDVYRFLCINYEPEDEIYLFGFSRGAYTIRCLAGLIYNTGLPRRQFIRKIPEAYAIYRDKENEDKHPDGRESINFRNKYGERVPIKALCCWDTVAAIGFPDLLPGIGLDEKLNEKYRFYDSTINPTVEKAIHAVAIDEIRKVFDVTRMEPHRTREKEQVTQVWFPGGHGCIGGGSKEERGLSDRALRWMIEQVKPLGLALDEKRVEFGLQPDYKSPFDNTPKFPFNLGSPNIRGVTGEFSDLHESVKQRWADTTIRPPYRPENLMKFREELDAWKPIASAAHDLKS